MIYISWSVFGYTIKLVLLTPADDASGFLQVVRWMGIFCSDPNADPDHTGSGRRQGRGTVWKAAAHVTNNTKCA